MSFDPLALGRAVKQAQYRHHRALERHLDEVGTTLAQWDALRAIDSAPGESAHALAEATFQSDQAFGTLANRLAARKLIARAPGHGRRVEHQLTAAGRELLVAGERVARQVMERSFGDLSESERRTLAGLLDRIGHDAVAAGGQGVKGGAAQAQRRKRAAPQRLERPAASGTAAAPSSRPRRRR